MTDPRVSPPLTSQVAHVGNLMKHVLDELVAKNTDFYGQPLAVFGPSEDAASAAPPAIYWAPVSERFSPGQRQGMSKEPAPLFTRNVPVSFLLFGGVEPEGTYSDAEAAYHDCDLTEILLSKLVNSFQRNCSQQSYALDAVTWFNGGKTGIGMSCELTVGVCVPVVKEDNPVIHVSATQTTWRIKKP
jgi:hypothetical protein